MLSVCLFSLISRDIKIKIHGKISSMALLGLSVWVNLPIKSITPREWKVWRGLGQVAQFLSKILALESQAGVRTQLRHSYWSKLSLLTYKTQVVVSPWRLVWELEIIHSKLNWCSVNDTKWILRLLQFGKNVNLSLEMQAATPNPTLKYSENQPISHGARILWHNLRTTQI